MKKLSGMTHVGNRSKMASTLIFSNEFESRKPRGCSGTHSLGRREPDYSGGSRGWQEIEGLWLFSPKLSFLNREHFQKCLRLWWRHPYKCKFQTTADFQWRKRGTKWGSEVFFFKETSATFVDVKSRHSPHLPLHAHKVNL